MNIKTLLSLVCLLVISACSHHHSHEDSHAHHHGNSKMELNNGEKWKADEVLSRNMDLIHTELHKILNKQDTNKAVASDYQRFQNKVQQATEEIISKCQMSPEMDETYHVVLEKMLEGSEKLQDSKTQKGATQEFVKAFHLYKQYFN